MPATTYEICFRGPVPAELLSELGDATEVAEPAQTVLLTGAIDQDGLHRLVARIRDLGLELRELRRMPRTRTRSTGRADR